MRSNTGVIGALRLNAPSGAPGVHGLADLYANVKNVSWPASTATASVVPSVQSVNEGGTVAFAITAYAPAGQTTLYWSMRATTGTGTTVDFGDSTISGSVVMVAGYAAILTGTVSRTWASDLFTEGTEAFVLDMALTNGGAVIGTSTAVTVADTSLTPVATVTGTPSSLNEGSAATYTVTIVSGLAAGATVYWVMRTTTGTALAADFTDNTLSGNYTVSNGLVDTVTRTWANDSSIAEGTEIWVMDVRIGSITGTLIGTSSPATTVADTSVSSAVYVPQVGTKAPVYGANGGAYPPTVSWSGLVNSSADDANIGITIPTFTIASTAYTAAYVGSNTYLTFGGGSNNYSGLSASNPAFPKIMMGASDNSYQRLSSLASGTDFVRIRYEGASATSGTAGSPTIVYEATFFNPASTGGLPIVEVLFGVHNRLSGITMIADASTSYVTFSIAANQSYVFVGNATGTAWTVYTGYYVSNTGY